jgi:NADH-quinone oxidoreductase subunit N
MQMDPLALLPELLLLAGAVLGLLVGSFLPRRSQWVVRVLAAAACLGSLVAAAVGLAGEPRVVLSGTFAVDTLTGVPRLVVASAVLLTIGLSIDTVRGTRRESEVYVLVLLAATGSLALAGASDVLVLAVGYLLASIPTYALAGWARDPRGAEAVLKYYLMGAFLGVAMLVGVVLLFALGGATTYAELAVGLADAPRAALALGVVALLAGLLFKAGAVPAHFWVPDVAQGATAPAAAFITTVPKVGALAGAYRLLSQALPEAPVDWPLLVAVIAAASMTLGNLAAFWQDDPKRLLGWSTVSQVGYLLMAVAVAERDDLALRGLGVYLAAYAVTNLGAFAVVAELPHARTLADYRGLARRRPGLAASLLVCLLGLVGTPPTAVFVGKATVFAATWDGGLPWLAVVAAVNTVASLFYYLRWVAPAFLSEAAEPKAHALAGTWGRVAAHSAAGASLALGLLAGPALAVADGVVLR